MKDFNIKSYKNRLVLESLLKSFLVGVIIGGIINIFYNIFAWLFNINIYYGLIIFTFACLFSSILVFNFKYKPSYKTILFRIDALGLEERLITMNQLKNDDSYIAQRQREDTISKVKELNSKALKIVLSIPILILSILCLLFNFGSTIAFANIKKPEPPDNYYIVSYEVKGEGSLTVFEKTIDKTKKDLYLDKKGSLFIIEKDSNYDVSNMELLSKDEGLKKAYQRRDGSIVIEDDLGKIVSLPGDKIISNGVYARSISVKQVVKEGNNSIPVYASPENTVTKENIQASTFNGWLKSIEGSNAVKTTITKNIFVGWSDALVDPFRFEFNIKENISVKALFINAESGEDNPENDDLGSSKGKNGFPTNGSGGSGTPSWDDPGDTPGSGGGSGGNPNGTNGDVFEDGKKHLSGAEWENAYTSAQEDMNNNSGLSPEEIALIEGYFKAIEQ